MNLIKKIILILIVFQEIFTICTFADDESDDNLDYMNTLEVSSETNTLILFSKYSLILERTTNTVLFEKNGYEKTAMASTTKIMTAIVALENSKLTDVVKISSRAANTSGSTLGIKKNSEISMENLLYGLLLRSGNDCAVAIAEYIGGNLENFAKIMNNKAKELNLNDTHFVTPHGLDDPNHYTTAYDLAILTNYALKNDVFSKIVATRNCNISIGNDKRNISNTNELLGYTNGVYGVKTGFTGNAGRCLVSSCRRNNLDIIIVVLGANTRKQRTEDSINLINYAYKNFEMIDLNNLINETYSTFLSNCSHKINLDKSSSSLTFKLLNTQNTIIPIKKFLSPEISSSIYYLSNLEAPISNNAKIGVIQIKINAIPILESEIRIAESIQKYTIKDYFFKIIKKIL